MCELSVCSRELNILLWYFFTVCTFNAMTQLQAKHQHSGIGRSRGTGPHTRIDSDHLSVIEMV